ncbi:MAG: C39 family peptidase [Myxococcota bacterium]|nr:C39 family peptidase [Myxococcota bacterium]
MTETTHQVHSPVGGSSNRCDRLGPVAPLPRNLVRVPSVKQRTDFSCGAAATLSLLRYWRWNVYARVDETALYVPLKTTRSNGTEPEPIAAFLSIAGEIPAEYAHTSVTVADLEQAVDSREPPIVDLQAWIDDDMPWRDVWDAGHYVIMVGYDDERVFFMDPSTMTPGGCAYLPRREFHERWHDLAGDPYVRLEHMAIFAHGSTPVWVPNEPAPERAAKLG